MAQHGSWNSDVQRGYKVTRIGTDEHGEALASTSRDFFAFKGPGAWWTTAPGTIGPIRPVEVRVGPEGEMYVSSDSSGQIIVIRHINDRHTPVLVSQLVSSGYNYSTVGGPTKATSEFSFDMPRTQGSYRWLPGTYPRLGIAQFDGASLHVNMTAADNNAGATSPNITGGNSTYEMWINVDKKATGSGGPDSPFLVVLELLQPGMTADQDDYLRIYAQVTQDAVTAKVWAAYKQPGQTEIVLADPIPFPAGEWHHLALVLDVPHGSMLCLDGCAEVSVTISTFVPLMSRRSALLGHSHRYTQGGMLVNFTGYLDDVRLYSYALSRSQLQLNYLLSADDRTNPVLQANLHMQPPENSEAQYFHVGPTNHYGPQPAADLFPGWIVLNGSQLVNLSNPMSGVGHAWKGDLFTAVRSGTMSPAMALEFWFRLWNDNQVATGVTLLNAQPLVRVYWSLKQLRVQVGTETFEVPFSPTDGWTHLVLTASPAVGGSSYYTAYVNGTSIGYKGGEEFKGGVVGNDVTLGGIYEGGTARGIQGDLAVFRVYDFALNSTQVRGLYLTQVSEGYRMRQEMLAFDLDMDGDMDDDAKTPMAAIVIGALLGAAVVVAVLMAIMWRIHKSRGQMVSRSLMSEGYSAELMSDAR